MAVASARLLQLDPAALHLRQQYAASLTPTSAAVLPEPAVLANPSASSSSETKSAAGSEAVVSVAAAAASKPHAEAAAANWLLLGQPAAAAKALAGSEGGCSAVTLQAAARVAALAAAHKVCLQMWCASLTGCFEHCQDKWHADSGDGGGVDLQQLEG